jgi:hypothetical protein
MQNKFVFQVSTNALGQSKRFAPIAFTHVVATIFAHLTPRALTIFAIRPTTAVPWPAIIATHHPSLLPVLGAGGGADGGAFAPIQLIAHDDVTAFRMYAYRKRPVHDLASIVAKRL